MKITEIVGNTPLLDISSLLNKKNVSIFGKCECFNPGGSVKDRPALWMIQEAEKRGELKKGMKLIEPTSGNTGIALAMIASSKGYPIELVMPENSTKERVQLMQAYGAKVTLTSREKSMEGAIDYAHDKVKKGGYFMLNQFANDDNWRAHYNGTGPEIWKDTKGKVSHFVSAMGTTGTIMGVSRFLKEKNSGVNIIGCQPKDGARIPGIRKWPKEYLPKIFDESRVDQVEEISEQDAIEMSKRLAKEIGIFVGTSAGGAVHASIELAKKIDHGVIVTILCDRGERYLSTNIF